MSNDPRKLPFNQPAPAVQVPRPTLEALDPGDVAELNARDVNPDDYDRVELRGLSLSFSVTPDGSVLLTTQTLIPADQLAKGPSRLLVGLGAGGPGAAGQQKALVDWWTREMGVIVPNRVQLVVKRGAVKDGRRPEVTGLEDLLGGLGIGGLAPGEPGGGHAPSNREEE